MSNNLKERVSAAVALAAPSYNISRVYLFGSVARGDDNAQSDVDLCVESDGRFSLFDAGAFGQGLQTALGRSVDLVSETSCRSHVKGNMLKERVLIYER